MTPHDTLIVKLPYPVKILGATIYIHREIGFNFTNRLKHTFARINKIKSNKDFESWIEKNGQQAFINENLFASAVAYCEDQKKKENFTHDNLIKALNNCDRQTQEQIKEVWSKSEEFGAVIKKNNNRNKRT